MGLNKKQLKTHIESIITFPFIRNKIIILCEGNIHDLSGHLTHRSYRKMKFTPDADFYQTCVPVWWREGHPLFFNCGDKNNVIDTYFGLLERHHADPSNSYLAHNKLFAIVDLDLQPCQITYDYPFDNTEAIFKDMYDKGEINRENILKHHIMVTGFIHKEAYFIHPELQDLFKEFEPRPTFQGNPLNLDNMYQALADTIENDSDLKNNFERACNRIHFCDNLDCQTPVDLKETWQNSFRHASDAHKKNLIYAVLMISKVKKMWNEVYL